MQNNQPPPPNPPAVPNVILERDLSDVDGMADYRAVIWLHKQGLINLRGIITNTQDPYSASTTEAVLNYWGLQNTVPVLAYQGSSGAVDPGTFTHGTMTQFRPQDGTLLGVLDTVSISSGGGSGGAYQVGDVLAIPLGSGVYGTPAGTGNSGCPTSTVQATFKVVSVSAGGIATGRIVSPGCYSTAPSSPATLPNPHGGAGAVIAFGTGTNRGLYEDPMSGLTDLLTAYPGLIEIAAGASYVDDGFTAIASNLALWNANLGQLLPNQGVNPNNVLFGGTGGGEYNMSDTAQGWANVYARTTVPVVSAGVEMTGAPFPPAGNQGWVVAGPVDAVVVGSISGTALSIGSVTQGTVAANQSISCNGCAYGSYIQSGGGASWTISPSQTVPAGTVIYLIGDANKLVDPVEYAFSIADTVGPNNNATTYLYMRSNWTWASELYAAFGINPSGSTYQRYMYWAGNNGTMSVTVGGTTNGQNAWSATPAANDNYIRKVATDAQIMAWLNNIMADQPSNYANDGVVNRRTFGEPGARAGSRQSH